MSDEGSFTIGKDTMYGSIIVVLAGLLVLSVFTQGFGVVKADCPTINSTDCPEVSQENDTSVGTDTGTDEVELPELKVEFGSYPPLGDENAPVAMVEFSEFQCPYCARLYSETETKLKTNYMDNGKLKLYFRDFPLPPEYHPQAGATAIAARCADEQGKFWEMHHKLFDTRDSWSGNSEADLLFKQYAIELGMDNETFSSCYDNQSHTDEIVADLNAGYAAGVGGTPSSFLIIPKSRISGEDVTAVVASLNDEYGNLGLFEDENDYLVFIPGAYPYDVFDAVLSAVNY